MSRRYLIAGNWKMNKTASEGAQLIRDIMAQFADCKCKYTIKCPEILVCPPFTSIAAAVKAAKGTPVKVGAQNVHFEEKGAYTGEISGAMLVEAGVSYVIVGHSERRQYFAETNETVNKRLLAALKNGLRNAGQFLKDLLVFLVEALPVLLVLVPVVWLVVWLICRIVKKSRAKKAAKKEKKAAKTQPASEVSEEAKSESARIS